MSQTRLTPPVRGYRRGEQSGPKGCICPEELEHDGKCQNGLRDPKAAKCPPCSQGWHFDGPCKEFKAKGGSGPMYSTQCDLCGWDLGEHPLTESQRALIWQRRS